MARKKKSLESAKKAAIKRQTSFREALAAWQEVHALYPDDLEARHHVASLLIRLQRHDEARPFVENFAADDGEALIMRGELAMAASDLDAALDFFTRAETEAPRNELRVQARERRIEALISLERYSDALELEDEKPKPTSWWAWRDRGLVQLRCRDYTASAASLRAAISIQPRDGATHEALARACVRGGNLTGAIEALKNAVRLDYTVTLWSRLAGDPDFASLREDARFVALTQSP